MEAIPIRPEPRVAAGAAPISEGRSLLTAAEVASFLGVPKSWVYEQSRSGRIPTVTLGRYRRYRREAIAAWIEGIETPGRPIAAARR